MYSRRLLEHPSACTAEIGEQNAGVRLPHTVQHFEAGVDETTVDRTLTSVAA